jgi:hypothetical protein
LSSLTRRDGVEIASFDFSAPSAEVDDNQRNGKGNGKTRNGVGGSSQPPVETRKKKKSGKKGREKLGAGGGDAAENWAGDD